MDGANTGGMRLQLAQPLGPDDLALDCVGLPAFENLLQPRELAFLHSNNHFAADFVGNLFLNAELLERLSPFPAIDRFE
jgi:hypothetical protein